MAKSERFIKKYRIILRKEKIDNKKQRNEEPSFLDADFPSGPKN